MERWMLLTIHHPIIPKHRFFSPNKKRKEKSIKRGKPKYSEAGWRRRGFTFALASSSFPCVDALDISLDGRAKGSGSGSVS